MAERGVQKKLHFFCNKTHLAALCQKSSRFSFYFRVGKYQWFLDMFGAKRDQSPLFYPQTLYTITVLALYIFPVLFFFCH